MVTVSTVLLASFGGVKAGDTDSKDAIIGKATPTIENGIMTPELLHSFGKIGAVQVSPNKKELLYHEIGRAHV